MSPISRRTFCQGGVALAALATGSAYSSVTPLSKQILDKQTQLDRWSFWSNQDWEWYKANIPFWESPHSQIDEIYYYRAEVLTKHLRYAAPGVGYVFTEFSSAEKLPWAGRFNAIASAADLQMEEARWLKTRQYVDDYVRYWMLVEGAQPRNYGFAVAWSAYSVGEVHGDHEVAIGLLDKYVENYELWEKGVVDYPHDNGFDSERRLFWNTGRDVGGEYNLASCQLSESLRGICGYKIRGGAGYRPDINAIMFGEATAISRLASLAGRHDMQGQFEAKAAIIKANTQKYLWDSRRDFFVHRWRRDEYSEGDLPGQKSIREWSLLWETNSDRNGGVGYQPEKEGNGRGREITGFIPWRYGLPDDNDSYASAWRFLLSEQFFYAPYGPTTAERNDPWFHVIYHACRHNGQSWPFHTSRVLNAAGRLLNDYRNHGPLGREQYFRLFEIYAKTQYKDGRPYLAEAHSPFSPVWVQDLWPGIDYFHSSYMDLVITGLAGLRPNDGDTLEVNPMAPLDWDYFALDDVSYHNHRISILWDRHGQRYGVGAGLTVLVDGEVSANSRDLRPLRVRLANQQREEQPYEVNYAANCEGTLWPKADASFTAKYDSANAPLEGLHWYDPQYGSRWTCRGSWRKQDWYEVDFGSAKTIGALRLFLYADDIGVSAPDSMTIVFDVEGEWKPVDIFATDPPRPAANRANTIEIRPITTRKMRVLFDHAPGVGVGLAQIQALAPATDSYPS